MCVGIIGAGQFSGMMALSGIPLGLHFTMYDRSADAPGASPAIRSWKRSFDESLRHAPGSRPCQRAIAAA